MKRPSRLIVFSLLLVLRTGVAEAYDQRYRDQENGTVKDTRSGLIWLAHANCWGPLPWGRAQAEVAKLQDGMCGLTDGSKPGDWRLPTEEEWELMVECACGEITLSDDRGTDCYAAGDSTFHDVQAREYWSSTESISGKNVRVMSLVEGLGGGRSSQASLPVWPVRD